jgi:hypothetical protein
MCSSEVIRKLIKSVWLFPLLLFVLLLLLTAFKVSGTSVGVYYSILYGSNQKDPNLLAGQPQPVRSDEYDVDTQMTIAQSVAGYPRINPNVQGGHDMSLIGDAPYKDWSAVFRPQNLIFFILPLAYAFAFKWWLLLFLLIISCYFVVLRFFSRRRLLAVLISCAVGFSPFIFWWYQTATLAPIFYGFFILLIGIRIINGEKIKFMESFSQGYSQLIYSLTLSYLLVSFILILYPPFQVPIALVVGTFLVGYMLEKYGLSKRLFSRNSLRQIGVFVLSLIITCALLLLFIDTRRQAIDAIQHTLYPSSREVAAGHTPLFEIFSSYLQPQLERTSRAANYYTNQSEASDFILFLPFLMIPGFALIFLEYRQKKKLRWSFLLIQLLAILLLANMFVTGLQPIYKILFLDKIPHDRLFIGLGFAGVLQLLLVMNTLSAVQIPKAWFRWGVCLYTFMCLLVVGWAGRYVSVHYPLFIHSKPLIAFYGITFAFIIFCFLSRRFMLAATVFLIFSLGCIFRVDPLYRGLGPLYDSQLSQAISSVSKPGSTWVTVDEGGFENAAMLANRNSLSGVQLYPDVNLWAQVEGPSVGYIYNRYAHIQFISSDYLENKLKLIQFDLFEVQFSCSPFIQQHVQYVLASHSINEECTKLVDQVHYPALTFYIYQVD